jgi:SAM-dependent methyltransferase
VIASSGAQLSFPAKMTNLFSFKSAAERYPKGRPYFHPLVIERIRAFLSLTKPVHMAIDVGCGTGLSTIALREIAERVFGVDASSEMVALAEKGERSLYAIADATHLPFVGGQFDLMTLSSAFHWLERERFLREADRVLRPEGWLINYDNYFSGRMEERQDFQKWFREVYLKKYPPPPRASLNFSVEDSGNGGFHLAGHEAYQNKISFTVDGLIDYLTTHSNIIAAVEGGSEEIEDVRRWIESNLAPVFGELREATFLFHGPIWYLRKTA